MKLIPLDAVLAEIERLKENANKRGAIGKVSTIVLCNELLSFLDSLEVKEVDLEKEIIKWHKEHFKKDGTFIGMSGFYLTNNSQMDIAKHFFELGVNASNSLTWEDIKTIYLLVQVEWNPKKSDEEIYKEVLKRFKVQKGEKI